MLHGWPVRSGKAAAGPWDSEPPKRPASADARSQYLRERADTAATEGLPTERHRTVRGGCVHTVQQEHPTRRAPPASPPAGRASLLRPAKPRVSDAIQKNPDRTAPDFWISRRLTRRGHKGNQQRREGGAYRDPRAIAGARAARARVSAVTPRSCLRSLALGTTA